MESDDLGPLPQLDAKFEQRWSLRGLCPKLALAPVQRWELEFVHYDGFDLRVFTVDARQESWSGAGSRQTLYTNREDSAFD